MKQDEREIKSDPYREMGILLDGAQKARGDVINAMLLGDPERYDAAWSAYGSWVFHLEFAKRRAVETAKRKVS